MHKKATPHFVTPTKAHTITLIARARWILTVSLAVTTMALNALAQTGLSEGKDGFFFEGLYDLTWLEKSPKSSGERIRFDLDLISRVNALLSRRGVKMVFALVPMVERVYENKLPDSFTLPASSRTLYDKTLNTLRTNGVVMPDLNTAMIALARNSDPRFPVYLRQDNHWSPLGAFEASRLVAEQVRRSFPQALEGLPEVKYDMTWEKPIPFNGNYYKKRFSEAERSRIGKELFTPVQFTMIGGSDATLFGERKLGVTVVGTSFTENREFAFDAGIAYHLKRETVNFGVQGTGPWTPMLRYLASTAFQNTPPQVLVWEFPEAFLARAMTPIDSDNLTERSAALNQMAADLGGDCGSSGIRPNIDSTTLKPGSDEGLAKLNFRTAPRRDQFLSVRVNTEATFMLEGPAGKSKRIEAAIKPSGTTRINIPLGGIVDNKGNTLHIRTFNPQKVQLEDPKLCPIPAEMLSILNPASSK